MKIKFFSKKKKKNKTTQKIIVTSTEKTKLDDNYIALLSLFQNPRSLDNLHWQEIWSETLKSPYKNVIEDFIKHDLLTEASTKQKLSASLRVSDLKPILKKHGLKASGKKDELVLRFIENLPEEAEKNASSISNVYVCTDNGAEIAQRYKNKVDLSLKNAEEEVKKLLRQKKINEAVRIIDQFLASLPSPMSHGGAMPSDAQAILEIKSVPGMTNEELEEIKQDAAADAIWGRKIGGSKQFLSVAYKQMFKRTSLATLEGYRESGVVKKVQIICAHDSCPICKTAAKYTYSLDKALASPPLPIEGCTHEIGWCRCTYVVAFDD